MKEGTLIAFGYDPKLESENADFESEDRAEGATIDIGYYPKLESENADLFGELI
jgi:hypothetical protein